MSEDRKVSIPAFGSGAFRGRVVDMYTYIPDIVGWIAAGNDSPATDTHYRMVIEFDIPEGMEDIIRPMPDYKGIDGDDVIVVIEEYVEDL